MIGCHFILQHKTTQINVLTISEVYIDRGLRSVNPRVFNMSRKMPYRMTASLV